MKTQKDLVLVIAIAAILVLGGISYADFAKSKKRIIPPEEVACTLDAKLCPDGSYVGRMPPSCEFATCSAAIATTSLKQSGITGMVLLGPQCPVVREGEECPDKPFATKLVVITPDGSSVIKEFSSNASGEFRVEVLPGTYAIRSAGISHTLPYCGSTGEIVVVANTYTSAAVSCDTGIR